MQFLLRNFCPQHLEKISLLCCNKQRDVKEKVKVEKGSIRQLFCKTRWNNKINWQQNMIQQNPNQASRFKVFSAFNFFFVVAVKILRK
jgi:hypothetical protein